jgi:hypothetical protein
MTDEIFGSHTGVSSQIGPVDADQCQLQRMREYRAGHPSMHRALHMATNPQLRRELTHGEAILMAKIDMRVDDLIISLRLFAGNQLAGVAAAAIRQAVATAVGAKLAGD